MRPIADPPRPQRVRSSFPRLRWWPTKGRRTAPERPLDAVGQARVETWAPLAYRLAWRFVRHRDRGVPPPDELISEALYGLTYAAGLFDEARGVPFGPYAAMVVRHQLIHAVLRWRRRVRLVPYPTGRPRVGDERPWDDDPWEAEDRRTPPDPATGAATREMCDRIRRAMPASWYRVIRLFYGEGYTYTEIARRTGQSREAIRLVVRKATARARSHFPDWPG